MMVAGLIAVLVVAAFVLGILLMYIGSVMRFILFDSVLAKECRIRAGWSRRQAPGFRYFLWKLVYMLALLGGLVVLVGIPAGVALAAVLRTLLVAIRIEPHLGPLTVVYPCLAVLLSCVVWMIFFNRI